MITDSSDLSDVYAEHSQFYTRSKTRSIAALSVCPKRSTHAPKGQKTTAQGKRAQRATPWVTQRRIRYAPEGGKSSDRGQQPRSRAQPILLKSSDRGQQPRNPLFFKHFPSTNYYETDPRTVVACRRRPLVEPLEGQPGTPYPQTVL